MGITSVRPHTRIPPSGALRAALGGRYPLSGSRIGLLGGSFNPAHQGHLDISLWALRALDLTEVWWLVAPQNPLKSPAGMHPLAERMAGAQKITKNQPITVNSIESHLNTRFTADSCRLLVNSFPKVRFVWLMGADNLVQIEHWERWHHIFDTLSIAIFDRPNYSLRAGVSKAARRYRLYRVDEGAAHRIAKQKPPAWVFVHIRLNPLSATDLRNQQASANGT